MGEDFVDEDVIVEMDGTTGDDEPTWASGQGLDGFGTDIVLDSRVSFDYDGDEDTFWEHVAAWGKSVLGALEPSHGILVTASNMRTTRNPSQMSDREDSAGETEFESIANSLWGEVGFSFMTVNCFPKEATEALPMDVLITFPTVVVETYDIPIRDWLATTFAMPTEELRRTIYVSSAEYEFLQKLDAEQGGTDGQATGEEAS